MEGHEMAKGKSRARRGRRPARKEWSFLTFIAGDNNLSDFGLVDIREMAQEGAGPNVYVGAEIDTYGPHTGPIRYEITEPDWTGTGYRTVIERLPERDSGEPKVLRNFVRWGLRRYPARQPVLVVWNHGAGFRSTRRDIAYDDFGSSLDMPEIERALRAAGVSSNNRIAVLGFDACLMNMLEIAYHFRRQVQVLVGSQQTEPGDGWPYHEVLREIKSASGPQDLGRRIVDVYIRDYRRKGVANVTQSAIALDRTPAAARATGDLGSRLVQALAAHANVIRHCRLEAQSFHMADYIDLEHFSSLVARRVRDAQVTAAANRVVAATRASVIANGRFGDSVRSANGLSIWFPSDPTLYMQYRPKYLALRFARRHRGWLRFLDRYHS
jgi:hypothetical protein